MRTKLTPAFIAKATATGRHQVVYWDAAMPGFGLMVTPAGHKSFVVQYRANGKSRRSTIKFGPGLDAARREARALQGSVAKGGDPVGKKEAERRAIRTTLTGVFGQYMALEGVKLRTGAARRATFGRLVLPVLGGRPIGEIRRGEIIALLDKIERENGAVMASAVLAILRRVLAWHAVRDEDFHTPIVRGMNREPTDGDPAAAGRSRSRILNDAELRAFWKATDSQEHPYSRMARFILLTATRRDEAADLKWPEIDGDTWTIPAARYKSSFKNGFDIELPLSSAAAAVLAASPKIGAEGWVFTIGSRARTAGQVTARIGSFTRQKKLLDARMLIELRKVAGEQATLPRWTLHDLRRSARSLMSRAGVPADHAERCLGHVIGGVRGIYDRHAFAEEKRAAFEALAAQIERILNPQPNVVPLRRG